MNIVYPVLNTRSSIKSYIDQGNPYTTICNTPIIPHINPYINSYINPHIHPNKEFHIVPDIILQNESSYCETILSIWSIC